MGTIVQFFCLFLWLPYEIKELSYKNRYDILITWETKELKAAALHFGGAYPPDERKEGIANDYIF